jgi:hypothetical protein
LREDNSEYGLQIIEVEKNERADVYKEEEDDNE